MYYRAEVVARLINTSKQNIINSTVRVVTYKNKNKNKTIRMLSFC